MSELIAARDIFWMLTKQASGFFLMDERRPGGPRFATLKDEIAIQLDRQSALVREHPEFRERYKLVQHTDAVNANAERQRDRFWYCNPAAEPKKQTDDRHARAPRWLRVLRHNRRRQRHLERQKFDSPRDQWRDYFRRLCDRLRRPRPDVVFPS